jgi:hypothetical protein
VIKIRKNQLRAMCIKELCNLSPNPAVRAGQEQHSVLKIVHIVRPKKMKIKN